MAHHKKGRIRRNRRAGCKLCKPWKLCGFDKDNAASSKFSDYKRRRFAAEAIRQEAR